VGTVASFKPQLLAQVTFCSSNDSDASFLRFSTVLLCPAPGSRSRINHHSTPTSDKVRKRYLHRLGICAVPIEQLDTIQQQVLTASPTFTLPCSAPEKKIGYYVDKVKHDSLHHSCSQGDIPAFTLAYQEGFSRHDEIILLRRSVQYTTKLKSDLIGEHSNSIAPTPLPKFELLSAWTSLLSNDTASTFSSSAEPLDGTFNLFSLPSEASIAFSRCDSAKSLDTNTIARNVLTSRDDLSLSSIPKQRKVSFDSRVKAATIPSRHSYSNRRRRRCRPRRRLRKQRRRPRRRRRRGDARGGFPLPSNPLQKWLAAAPGAGGVPTTAGASDRSAGGVSAGAGEEAA